MSGYEGQGGLGKCKVDIVDCDFHRNGVNGSPAYFVAFNLTNESTEELMLAVIPATEAESHLEKREYVDCFVVSIERLPDISRYANGWRGDKIYKLLVDAGLWNLVELEQSND